LFCTNKEPNFPEFSFNKEEKGLLFKYGTAKAGLVNKKRRFTILFFCDEVTVLQLRCTLKTKHIRVVKLVVFYR